MSRSIIAVAAMSSPKISPHLLNGLLRGDDHRRAFVAVGDEANIRFAASGSNGM